MGNEVQSTTSCYYAIVWGPLGSILESLGVHYGPFELYGSIRVNSITLYYYMDHSVCILYTDDSVSPQTRVRLIGLGSRLWLELGRVNS